MSHIFHKYEDDPRFARYEYRDVTTEFRWWLKGRGEQSLVKKVDQGLVGAYFEPRDGGVALYWAAIREPIPDEVWRPFNQFKAAYEEVNM